MGRHIASAIVILFTMVGFGCSDANPWHHHEVEEIKEENQSLTLTWINSGTWLLENGQWLRADEKPSRRLAALFLSLNCIDMGGRTVVARITGPYEGEEFHESFKLDSLVDHCTIKVLGVDTDGVLFWEAVQMSEGGQVVDDNNVVNGPRVSPTVMRRGTLTASINEDAPQEVEVWEAEDGPTWFYILEQE